MREKSRYFHKGSDPTLLVTAGDPTGIGPEVILKALRRPLARVRLLVIGDARVFEATARRLGIRRARWPVVRSVEALACRDTITLLDLAHAESFPLGRTSRQAGAVSLRYLDVARDLLKRGVAQGIVTAPVTKYAIQQSSPSFSGHTEYFARAFARPEVVMMFASDRMRVVLLSRHVALRRVAASVTAQTIRTTLRVTIGGLRQLFRVTTPRLAVLGLNPHAGEDGAFGDEERRVLRPALKRVGRSAKIDGPFAADGFFSDASKVASYDAVICWYHDQGLIPFKMRARDAGCQVTLGLPFVRTSPDHGSALDIAGKGIANPGSMRYALELAARLIANR